MKAENSYDVIVVGAGPVGSAAASIAARHGLRCLLVDESTEVFPLPRAIHFDADIMRIFQFADLADRIEPLTRATTGGVHLGADHRPIREFRVADAPGDMGWRPHYMFFQPELDAELRRAAEGNPLVDVRLGWRCTGVQDAPHDATVTLASPDGTTTVERARFIIAADGSRSTVRRQLGIQLTDYAFEEPWIIIDGEVPDESLGPDYTIMYCDPARPGTYIPGPRRHRRWEFMLLPGETGEDLHTEEGVRGLIQPHTTWVDVKDIDIGRSAVYSFHALVADRWRSGHVFLAGDAVHQTPPFYGQGMCHGVRDVRNLLWKVAEVIQNGADETLLDSYQAEREPHVRAIIDAAVANGRYICTLDPVLAAERDRDLRARAQAGGDVRSFRDVIPGLTTGLIDHSRPSEAMGLLFVQPSVRVAGSSGLLDASLKSSFALVSVLPVERDDSVLEFERHGGRVLELGMTVEDLDGTLGRWFDVFGCTAALIRPDRYVFGTAQDPSDVSPLLQRLENACRAPATSSVVA